MEIIFIAKKRSISSRIKRSLESAGHDVKMLDFKNEEGWPSIGNGSHDLIILESDNNNDEGLELVCNLRKRKVKVPILLMSSMDSVDLVVRGLGAGADDVQKLSISVEELVARVSALKRRADYDRGKDIIVGDLRLDPIAQKVWQGGIEIGLAGREYDLLAYFMRFPGQELTRSMITVEVWEGKLNNFSNIVDVYVNYLRKKLGSNGKVTIQTVRGKGYVLR